MRKTYKIALGTIASLIIVVAMVLTHFELWNIANNNEYLAINTSGCINIIYSDEQDVLMLNPKSLSDEDGLANIPNTITITNRCKTNENITLYVDVYDDSTINDNKIKVNVNGDLTLKTQKLMDLNKLMGETNILNTYKLLNFNLQRDETKRINLRFWLDENEIVTLESNRFHAKYYIMSDSINSKNNFKETLLNNNEIKENDGLIKLDNSYYFNGNVSNNYVKFANLNWRILSINEDNFVKLIYSDNDLVSIFNNDLYSEEKVSYDNSNIKEYLDNFYNEKLSQYDKYIKTSKYIIDTSYEKTWRIIYGAYNRNFNLNEPSLNSFETDKEYGGVKEYKIGLITLDEANIAGLSQEENNDNYLLNGVDYYTISPAIYNGVSYVGIINKNGKLDATKVNDNINVKPTITIDGSVLVSGIGTSNDPYVILN